MKDYENPEAGLVAVAIEVGAHLGQPAKKYGALFNAPLINTEGDFADEVGAMVANTLLKHFGVVELLDEVSE